MLQVITVISIAVLVAADQIVKLLVIKHLVPIGSFTLIDGVIRLRYVENTGAAFGSFEGKTSILSMVTFVVIVVGLVYLLTKKKKPDVEYVCYSLIIAGGLGNLIDRVFRGYVIDYIEPIFVDFAVFNFADILVTCSAIFLIIWMLYDICKSGRKQKDK